VCPDKKLKSHVLFKLSDIFADSLLRHEHKLGSFRKAEGFSERHKAPDGNLVNQSHSPWALF
jgi:hypothetical protein